tara:strand:+ start:306 stop:515 length:210 start_codon:yes stop_codon:yes gene_type:complete
MKVVYKATKRDLNMNTDHEYTRRIVKYICWGLGLGTFWLIMIINFLFYYADGIAQMFTDLFWAFIYLIA